jgi:expansin (peptidoglycan-binding protein)
VLRPFLGSAVLVGLLVTSIAACGSDPPASEGSSSSSSSGSSGETSSGGGGSGSSTVFSSEQKTGIATFYDADGSGNCSYDKASDLDVAAFNFPEYAKSAACGSCIAISGPKGAVTIRIVDSCPGCEEHHIDLSASAFAKIADPEAGRVPITYQTVACKVSGSMAYQFKDGSHEFWTAIQIRNHRLPIAKLEAKKSGAYKELVRADYNYFIDDSGIKDDPISIRITAADGQVIEDTMPGAKDHGGQEFPGHVQFK